VQSQKRLEGQIEALIEEMRVGVVRSNQQVATTPQAPRRTKVAGLPCRRDAKSNRLAVRLLIPSVPRRYTHIPQLLARKHLETLLDSHPEPFADALRLEAFSQQHPDSARRCCSIFDFTLDLINGPHSPWNQSAKDVFVESFITKYGMTYEADAIAERFYVRVKSLKQASTTCSQRETSKIRRSRKHGVSCIR
jgi:hypothetical protein